MLSKYKQIIALLIITLLSSCKPSYPDAKFKKVTTFSRKIVLIAGGIQIPRFGMRLALLKRDFSIQKAWDTSFIFRDYNMLQTKGGYNMTNFAFSENSIYLGIDNTIFEFTHDNDKVHLLRKLTLLDFDIPGNFRIGEYIFSSSKSLFIQVIKGPRDTRFLAEWIPSQPPKTRIIDRKMGASLDIKGKVFLNNNRANSFISYYTPSERIKVPEYTTKEINEKAFSERFFDYSSKYGWLISGSVSIPTYRKQVLYCPPHSNKMKILFKGEYAKWGSDGSIYFLDEKYLLKQSPNGKKTIMLRLKKKVDSRIIFEMNQNRTSLALIPVGSNELYVYDLIKKEYIHINLKKSMISSLAFFPTTRKKDVVPRGVQKLESQK
jgi:hypothetical protein